MLAQVYRALFSTFSGTPNLPSYVCDANFLARLLIVIEPFSVGQINFSELGARVDASCKELSLGLEIRELKPSAVKLEYVDSLGRVSLFV